MAKQQKFEDRIDQGAEAFEARVEAGAKRFESAVTNWVKNDLIFNWLRTTPARVLMWVFGHIVLFGGLIYCCTQERRLVWYGVAVILMVVMQALSVRFVFETDAKKFVDEYQRARRDRSYRRAYRNVRNALLGLVAFALLYSYGENFASGRHFSFWPTFYIEVFFDTYRVLSILVFLVGYFTLLPYWGWGFKGEPFRSRDEPID